MAKVELNYPDAPAWADAHAEQLLQGAATEFTWRVPMTRPGATSYNYKVTWFRNDGKHVTVGPRRRPTKSCCWIRSKPRGQPCRTPTCRPIGTGS